MTTDERQTTNDERRTRASSCLPVLAFRGQPCGVFAATAATSARSRARSARRAPFRPRSLCSSHRRTTMKVRGGWMAAGFVALFGVIAAPAPVHGRTGPAAAVADVVELRAARWVVAARVRLRGGPSDEASVLGGLSVNTPVHERGRDGDWCDVELAGGARGWVACRFLGGQPL